MSTPDSDASMLQSREVIEMGTDIGHESAWEFANEGQASSGVNTLTVPVNLIYNTGLQLRI